MPALMSVFVAGSSYDASMFDPSERRTVLLDAMKAFLDEQIRIIDSFRQMPEFLVEEYTLAGRNADLLTTEKAVDLMIYFRSEYNEAIKALECKGSARQILEVIYLE